MDLEQLTPLSGEIGISVDPTVVTWIYQVFQQLKMIVRTKIRSAFCQW